MNNLTDFQKRAILVLGDHNDISARGFALAMWPDNYMHERHITGGTGIQRGKGAWLSAGSYLAKMAKRGWVGRAGRSTADGYVLTQEGRELYREIKGKEATLP